MKVLALQECVVCSPEDICFVLADVIVLLQIHLFAF